MRICYGWSRKPMSLSAEQRYHPEQLMNRLGSYFPGKHLASPLVWMPVWILMDDQYVRLNSKDEIELACKLACIYHNGPDNRAPFCEDGDWQNVGEELSELGELSGRVPYEVVAKAILQAKDGSSEESVDGAVESE